jgi:hypothetical protein
VDWTPFSVWVWVEKDKQNLSPIDIF